MHTRPSACAVLVASLVVWLGMSCGGSDDGTGVDPPLPNPPARSYAMGWAPIAPRPEVELVLQVIDSLARVSDIAIVQQPVPWPELLAGASLDSLVEDRGALTDFLRLKGLELIFLVDPLDGLDRTREDPGLVEAGRTIREPEIRALHTEWVRRIAQRVKPAYFGLASEINTLAARGDPALYAELVDLINALAPQVRQSSPASRVFVSFQADEANGAFGDPLIDHFALIGQFDIDALGLSSYPVFAYDTPEQIPSDYFLRFDEETALPLLMVEGGWSSAPVPWSPGTPEQQADFVARFEELLDGVAAEVWVMLTFTDLDIPALGLPPDRAATLSNFAFMGVLDADLQRKPAYAEWKRIFDRPREP